MDLSDKQNRTPSVGREGLLFMRGMQRDVGASLSGPCNPTSCKSPAMGREQWPTQNSSSNTSNTSNTVHNRFYVVRREAYVHGRSKESIFIGREEYTLKISLLSWQEKKKQLEMRLENWRPEI